MLVVIKTVDGKELIVEMGANVPGKLSWGNLMEKLVIDRGRSGFLEVVDEYGFTHLINIENIISIRGGYDE